MQPDWLSSAVALSEDVVDTAQETLVREMLAGSERAWRAFHARYDRLITRCIARVTARFSAVMCQDEVRDIHATLLVQLLSNDMRKLRSFDAERGTRLGSWICALAVNCAYDYLRGARRAPCAATLDEAEVLSCDLPSPYEHVEHRERAELVTEVLRAFSDKDREFVTLYFGEGLPPEQVAERMRISVKTVYSKKHKIQSRLEAMLSDACLAA
jgi:RNA polymerase sigma-70 factor, ECF subfamily